jgi:2-phospho-L-lactate guanylyltransferase
MMLGRVVEALRVSWCLDHAVFVSVERDTIPADFEVLPDTGGGLNPVLEEARQSLIARRADEIVVLHADLPLVSGGDIDALVRAGRRTGLALAADERGSGTNALYLPARSDFRFQFGADSRRRHLEEAAHAGLTAVTVDVPGLSFDVDGPEDLERLLARGDPHFAPLALAAGNRGRSLRRRSRA